MTEIHMTEVPTLTNPMAFHTVDELRRELLRMHGIVQDMGMRLHEARQVAHEVTHDLALFIKVRWIFGDEGVLRLLTVLEKRILNPAAPAKTEPDNQA